MVTKRGNFNTNSVFWVTVDSPSVCVAGAEEERRGRGSRQYFYPTIQAQGEPLCGIGYHNIYLNILGP